MTQPTMVLEGKVALITGAAQGLGKAFSDHLLNCGARVALMDINATQGAATMNELQSKYGSDKVAFYKGSVTSQEEFEGVFHSCKQKFGGVDIVINNAGIGGESADRWERTIDVNLKSCIRGTRLAIDLMRMDSGGRGGVIVNVASMAGINPNPCSPTYCATKSAIIQYSLSMAKNPLFASNGVRINVLAPAFVNTPLMDSITDQENCLLPDVAQMIIQKAGIMSTATVAEALMELLLPEENKNGQVLAILQNGGKKYHTVP